MSKIAAIFSPKQPALPPPPPPPPTREDPAVLEAREKLRMSEKRRRGRAASVIAGKNEEALGEAPIVRPEATGAQVLG